jgi:hypothetical protein
VRRDLIIFLFKTLGLCTGHGNGGLVLTDDPESLFFLVTKGKIYIERLGSLYLQMTWKFVKENIVL